MDRAEVVARWFGVDAADDPYRDGDDAMRGVEEIQLRAGRVVFITGASGAGKSTLLRALARKHGARWVDLARVRLGGGSVVDCMASCLPSRDFADEEARIVAALEALSRVGLGEVWSYLRKPLELSEGQRWRLRVAVGLARAMNVETAKAARGTCVIAADEFCGLLDRVTAMVVARALRKAVDHAAGLGKRVCAVVASGHEDLLGALRPDVVVRCDFGKISVASC